MRVRHVLLCGHVGRWICDVVWRYGEVGITVVGGVPKDSLGIVRMHTLCVAVVEYASL